jgi:lysophospholipase L1-like esterase
MGFRGANYGIDGDTIGAMITRIDAVLNSDAEVVFTFAGTNTGMDESTGATKIARMTDYISQVVGSGKHLIIGTPFPRNTHSGTGAISAALMAEIIIYKDWVLSLNQQGVTALDFFTPFVDPQFVQGVDDEYGTPYSWVTRDGVHITPKAAKQAGDLLSGIIEQMMPNDLYTDTWFESDPNHASNRLTNGELAGSGGTANNGMTGTVATSWTCNFATSYTYLSGVASVAANADTGGQTQTVVITSDGSGASGGFGQFQFSPLGFTIDEPSITNGAWVQLMFKVRVVNNDGVLGALRAQLRNTSTAKFGHGLENTATVRENEPYPEGEWSGYIITEAVQYNTGNTFTVYLYGDILATVAGAATIYVDSALLLEVEDPALTFPYTP